MWVIEDYDGVRKVCATKEIALKEVLRMLKDFYKGNPNDEQELKDYRELMEEYFLLIERAFMSMNSAGFLKQNLSMSKDFKGIDFSFKM